MARPLDRQAFLFPECIPLAIFLTLCDVVCVCVCVCVDVKQAVVHVSMSDMFPHEPPRLVLQSVVQLMNRLPLTHTLAHYGYTSMLTYADVC